MAARFLPSPLNGQLGWVALQLGQVSDSKGTTRKVRDRAKAQLEVLQAGTFGRHTSGFHPAARDTPVITVWTRPGTALTLPTPQHQWHTQPAEHNQPKAPWSLCFREVLSLLVWVTHRGQKTEQVKHKYTAMFLQQGLEAGWMSHSLLGLHTRGCSESPRRQEPKQQLHNEDRILSQR